MTSIQSAEDVNRYERYADLKNVEDSGLEREVLKRWQLWPASWRFWSRC